MRGREGMREVGREAAAILESLLPTFAAAFNPPAQVGKSSLCVPIAALELEIPPTHSNLTYTGVTEATDQTRVGRENLTESRPSGPLLFQHCGR